MEKQINDATEPKLGLFLLLLMLCGRKPQRQGPRHHDWILPRGCVFAVRYSSR